MLVFEVVCSWPKSMPGTRSGRAMDALIHKAVQAAITKAGLVSNDKISTLMSDLEKNLKKSFASEIFRDKKL